MIYDSIIFTDSSAGLARIKPLGAFTIAYTLRQIGLTVLVIDHFGSLTNDKLYYILSNSVGKNTLFIGYSSSVFANSKNNFLPIPIEEFKNINKKIKEINPNTKIVFGGALSNKICNYNLKFRDNLGVDFAIHGYSESMIIEFVKNLKNNNSQKSNKIYNNLVEIDYDYKGDLIDYRNSKHYWHDTDLVFQKEALPLEIARGCIFKCKFCAYPLLGKNPNDNSYIRLEDNILEEILDNYQRFKTTTYVIVDDTFNERSEKIEMLLRIRDRSKLDLNFVGYNRLDLIARKKEQINLLKDLNFNGMFFGIESFNYDSAKSIGKGLRPEEAIETLYKLKNKFGKTLSITGGFIIGLPHETPETYNRWFDLCRQEDFPVDSFNIGKLGISTTSHSQSEFFKNPEKYGYVVGGKNYWKNAVWDSDTCEKIAQNSMLELFNSGRQKTPVFVAAGLSIINSNFNDLVSASYKNIKTKDLEIQFQNKIKEYLESVITFIQ